MTRCFTQAISPFSQATKPTIATKVKGVTSVMQSSMHVDLLAKALKRSSAQVQDPPISLTLGMRLLLTILVLRARTTINKEEYIVSRLSGRNKTCNLPRHALTLLAALSRASYAYRGYGWADWWYNRWVVLNCDESVVGKRCNSDTYAVTSNKNKNFGYPLITFCSPFWDEPSHIQAIQKTSQSEETKLNSLNMDSKGKFRRLFF